MTFLESFNIKLEHSADLFLSKFVNKYNTMTPTAKAKLSDSLITQIKLNNPQAIKALDYINAFNFGDEKSIDTFAQEMCFLLFRPMNSDFALNEISPLSYNQIKRKYIDFTQKAKELNLPKFGVIPGNDGLYPIFTTFYMRQYAYDDERKFEIDPGDVVLNCGACMGDSTIWFYREGASKVYNFEPMPFAFATLNLNLEQNNYPTNLSYRLAVGDKNQQLVFKEQLNHIGSSHQVSKDELKNMQSQAPDKNANLVEVQCIVLDEWLAEKQIKPDYIKMDLEGAEPQAIEGLKDTIATLKPKMAVCLYHRVSDMWVLPHRLQQLNPNYTFYCKKSMAGDEFVLYAIDKHKAKAKA